MSRCSQCGKEFRARACGPTHAMIAAHPSAYWPTDQAEQPRRRPQPPAAAPGEGEGA